MAHALLKEIDSLMKPDGANPPGAGGDHHDPQPVRKPARERSMREQPADRRWKRKKGSK
jgi:hypothetical protein